MRIVPILAATLVFLGPGFEAAAAPSPPHPPILVLGDAGFALPGSGVARGAGTPDDPYVIEGWTIVGSAGFAVRIVNTSAHVVLRDLDLLAPAGTYTRFACADACSEGAVLQLQGVANVTTERVAITGGYVGADVADSKDIALGLDVRPDFDLAGQTGLRIVRSSGVTLVESSVASPRSSFDVRASDGVVFEANAFVGAFPYAEVVDTGNFTFRSNLVDGARILVSDARDLAFEHNRFTGAAGGLRLSPFFTDEVTRIRVCGNTFTGVADHTGAFTARLARDLRVDGNAFTGNWRPLEVQLSKAPVVIEGNRIEGNERGMLIGYFGGFAIHNNSIAGNGLHSAVAATDLRWNWWGAADGPSGGAVGGSGDRVAEAVPRAALDPWLAEPPATPVTCAKP